MFGERSQTQEKEPWPSWTTGSFYIHHGSMIYGPTKLCVLRFHVDGTIQLIVDSEGNVYNWSHIIKLEKINA